jgi:hypothetical protein
MVVGDEVTVGRNDEARTQRLRLAGLGLALPFAAAKKPSNGVPANGLAPPATAPSGGWRC